MKKYMYVFVLLILSISSCKKDDFSDKGISDSFDLSATNFTETFKIDVFYPGASFPTEAVPTLYLLDGFRAKDDFIKVYLDLLDDNKVPKCIIISIDYKNGNGPTLTGRFRDLTYPQWKDTVSGNGMNFYDFITQQLIPEVESRYVCDASQRTLLGHSLGGYFTLFSVFNYADSIPLTFKNYIASSTTIMYGPNNYLFGLEENASQNITSLPINIYMATGSLEGIETNVLIEEFYNRIKSRNYTGLNIKFERFPTSHGTNEMLTYKKGLEYVFN